MNNQIIVFLTHNDVELSLRTLAAVLKITDHKDMGRWPSPLSAVIIRQTANGPAGVTYMNGYTRDGVYEYVRTHRQDTFRGDVTIIDLGYQLEPVEQVFQFGAGRELTLTADEQYELKELL